MTQEWRSRLICGLALAKSKLAWNKNQRSCSHRDTLLLFVYCNESICTQPESRTCHAMWRTPAFSTWARRLWGLSVRCQQQACHCLAACSTWDAADDPFDSSPPSCYCSRLNGKQCCVGVIPATTVMMAIITVTMT